MDLAGFYHILNRGVEKRVVFVDHSDYGMFLRIIERKADLHDFLLHAYALMPNHYHLLVETVKENLSAFMQQINAAYSIYFNRKYRRVGPLWQGRYKSFYIYNEAYLSTVIKYIENNPLKASLVAAPAIYPYVSRNTISFKDAAWSAEDDRLWTELMQSRYHLYEKCENQNPFKAGVTCSAGTGQKNPTRPAVPDDDFQGDSQDVHRGLPAAVELSRNIRLPDYFSSGTVTDEKVVQAHHDGYRQSEIAAHLKVSSAVISHRIARYYKKPHTRVRG